MGDDEAPLRPGDVRTGAEYEAARADDRRRLAEHMRHRRVHLGPLLSLVFEDRESIRATLEEALRSERVTDPAQVASEVDAFSAIVPREGRLGAELFLEADDPEDLGELAERLEGVEQTVYLEVGGRRAFAIAEEVLVPGEPVAHYVRFELDDEMRAAWRLGARVTAGADHPACQVAVTLGPEQALAIASGL